MFSFDISLQAKRCTDQWTSKEPNCYFLQILQKKKTLRWVLKKIIWAKNKTGNNPEQTSIEQHYKDKKIVTIKLDHLSVSDMERQYAYMLTLQS